MVDWSTIIRRVGTSTVKTFAVGGTSGRDLRLAARNRAASTEVNFLLNTHGVTYARRLARKALRRRGVSV